MKNDDWLIWYHRTKRSRKPLIHKVVGADSDLEDALTEMKALDREVLAIMRNGAFWWTLKDGYLLKKKKAEVFNAILESICCRHCGGVDAHRANCKGGFGL